MKNTLIHLKPIFLLLIFTFLITSCDQISSNKKVKLDEKLAKIESAQAADISPETLRPLFQLGSEHTDLQRENAKQQIKNKVVEWDLQVYEISSTNEDGVYKIQTMTGVKDGDPLFSKSDRKNFNVGTFINLYARNETEKQYILSLKTSDWIKIKGILTGESTLRNLEIDPAILMSSNFISGGNKDSLEKINNSLNHNITESQESAPTPHADGFFDEQNTEKSQAFKPSFDCSKASTVTEIVICSDESLAKLERENFDAYRNSKSINQEKTKIILKESLVERNKCGGDKFCIAHSLQQSKEKYLTIN